MENCLKTGAYVSLPDYGLFAAADVFVVGETRVVRFNGDLDHFGIFEPLRPITHILYLNNQENYWEKTLGIAVVAACDLVTVTPTSTTKETA